MDWDDTPKDFYDTLGRDYNAAIARCVPRYQEMLETILHYTRNDLNPKHILELGCGGGNLTALLRQRYPESWIVGVDLSAEMIEHCRRRFGPDEMEFRQEDIRDLSCSPGSVDLVVSSIAIHHLDDPAKRKLFQRIREWLAPRGLLVYSDQFAGGNREIYHKHIDRWRQEAFDLGATDAEWNLWMEHQDAHDHHASLADQLSWLKESGFQLVDCPWRYLLWTVVYAER